MFKHSAVCTSVLTAAILASPALAAGGSGSVEMAKPKLKAIIVAKPTFGPNEAIAFKVQFEGKQCVFNIHFTDSTGVAKTQGFFFNSPNQLEWAFSAPASYWGVGPGTYNISAVPHQNPLAAGAGAQPCTGGAVTASVTIDPPVKLSPNANKLIGSQGNPPTSKAIVAPEVGKAAKSDPADPDKIKPATPPSARF